MDDTAGRSPFSELLWRAWGALGVSSWVTDTEGVVDPEALIVVTAMVGDERLFQETIDWGILHAPLLLPGRLRRLARGEAEKRVGAWISTVAGMSSNVTWSTGEHAPIEGFEPSGKSRSFIGSDAARASIAALRWRSVVGANVRSEVMRSFHRVLRGSVSSLASSDIVAEAGATKTQVNQVLDDLVASGLVERSGSLRRRRYEPIVTASDILTSALWTPWQGYPYAPWTVAIELIPLLTRASAPADTAAQPISVAIDAHQAFNRALVLLGGFDRELARPVTSGSVAAVSSDVRDRARTASAAVAARLAEGV